VADTPPKRSRPSQEERSVSVHFRLPARQYDLTLKHAEQTGLPLAKWLRRVVADATRPPGPRG